MPFFQKVGGDLVTDFCGISNHSDTPLHCMLASAFVLFLHKHFLVSVSGHTKGQVLP